MRTTTKVLTVAATLVLALSLAAPLEASCGTLAFMTTTDAANQTSFITNPQFQNHPGYGTFNYGPYTYSTDVANPAIPPLTAAAQVSFWRTGTGDPAIGMGDDNGIYDMIANGGIFYTGYPPGDPAFPAGYLRGARMAGQWEPPGIDGCVEALSCMCLLITDQDGVDGSWAILGGESDANLNTVMDIGGSDGVANLATIRMVNQDAPSITGSRRDAVTFDVELDVTVAFPAGGVYTQDACACGPVGFKVLQQVLPEGSLPPSDRSSGWSEPNLVGGAAQGVTAFGATVTVESLCGASDTDVYLTTSLVFDSGFSTPLVSGNSTRVECGPTLADPNDRPRPTRPSGDRAKPRRK